MFTTDRDRALPVRRPIDLEIRVVRDRQTWNTLEKQWSALFEACPTATPPLRWEWMLSWWSLYGASYAHAGNQDQGLRIYTVWREDTLTAVLPLYLNRKGGVPAGPRRLMFISTGETEAEEICAEYLDMLYLPGEEACAERILQAILHAERIDWDSLELHPISSASPLRNWNARAAPQGMKIREVGSGFAADLEQGFEAYIGGLSANNRGVARKRMRSALRNGATLQVAQTVEEAEATFAELCVLHQARWQMEGQPGCFASPKFTAFHKRQAQLGVVAGNCVLARLLHNGDTLAALIGYAAASKFHVYVAGARLEDTEEVKGPGIVLHLLLTEYLARKGMLEYDYLAGEAPYKLQFTTLRPPRFGIFMERPTLRSALGKTVELAGKVVRKGQSFLSADRETGKRLSEAKPGRSRNE